MIEARTLQPRSTRCVWSAKRGNTLLTERHKRPRLLQFASKNMVSSSRGTATLSLTTPTQQQRHFSTMTT
jgi:hypothetical protein